MKDTCLYILLAVLTLPASAQPADWIGLSRDSVESKRGDFIKAFDNAEKAVDKEDMLCYDVKLLNARFCYQFVDEICRGTTITNRKQNTKDALKEAIDLERSWGNPTQFYADRTKVDNVEQAVTLADHMAKVIYPANNGIGVVWMLNPNPKEEGTTGGRYRYAVRYIEVAYANALLTTNYWD